MCATALPPRSLLGLAVLCTVLAMLLPMRGLEPFLLMLSSVFVPLYGVILGRLGFAKATAGPSGAAVDYSAAAIWIAGIASETNVAMIAMTISNSIRVKPCRITCFR